MHKTYNWNDPYKGLYNFVGGKVEPGEDSDKAAYRELQEETGITRQQIRLYRLMDIRYYDQDFDLELYVGQLDDEVLLREEKNPLLWLPLTEDFTDKGRFKTLRIPVPEVMLQTACGVR